MLGIEFPILAFSHCRDVIAAVTKAGGMGVLGVTGHTPEQLEIDCAWIENEIGPSRSYGIDVINYDAIRDQVADLLMFETLDLVKQIVPDSA